MPSARFATSSNMALVSGSGTSLKTIEYLAAGLPLVSTDVGVRYLDLRPGIDADVCDADEMPARVAALVGDPARAARLGESGRAAATRYGWDAVGAAATAALDRLVPARTGRWA